MNRLIEAAKYTAPEPMAYNLGIVGRQADYNFMGGARTDGPQLVIHRNIQAWDSKNFIDNADQVASAAQYAMQNQHAINQTMRETVLGVMA